ncbi:MAG TPA: hypothetical protein VG938_08875 [Verrucomicrobiae bacterium]|nr:hypothetical protein [Verrucomicrobiae bacterium]
MVKPIPATESVSEEKASYAPAEPEKTAEVFPTLEENLREEAGHPELGSIPVTEREHQIAEARKVHAAQGGQPVKPRLSFILSGGAAPDPEENQAALQTDGQKDSDASHLEAKTLHE